MSSQYGRLAEARDKARPFAPEDETVEVYASDLDAVLTHYAKISDEIAFAGKDAREAEELADDFREVLSCVMAFAEPKCIGDQKWIDKAWALLTPNPSDL